MTKIEISAIGKSVALVYIIALVLVYFSSPEPEPYETYDLTSSYIIVHWFDSEAELASATGDDTLAGLAECEYRPEVDVSFCDLWLVHPIDLQDEYAFDTIGHEVYHALKGDFHE